MDDAQATPEAPPPSLEDAVMELIRLREVDRQERSENEAALHAEIRALWLRLDHMQRRRRWFSWLFA